MIFSLIGNQNCGKTTLFNCLTGSNQHVGNFPGVTVEQKSGVMRRNADCTVVDLPGIYSLRPYTKEEIVARDFVLSGKTDAIINIVDVTNIERNLYLTMQLMTLQIPMVIALNMMDELRDNGGSVDVIKMSQTLGVPVVPISAAKNEGVSELIDKAINVAKSKSLPKHIDFCPNGPTHRCIHSVSHVIEDHAARCGISVRYAATCIVDNDEIMTNQLELSQNELDLIDHSIIEMESETGLDRNAAIATMRYDFLEELCADTVKKAHQSKEKERSIFIDKIATHRVFAIPLFFAIMILVFYLTFGLIGKVLSDLLATGIGALSGVLDNLLTAYGLNPLVKSLLIDGAFAGIGSVVSFLPYIVVLFFFLSILEDTGYMARVAFVMDSILRKFGLSGKSFVPMLIGFGCTVPAVLSTRTLSSDRDRKMTLMLLPYMSCSAKIPIYAVFSAAFFPNNGALVMSALYIGGILLAMLMALILKSTVFHGKPVPFILELPNYRFPSPKNVILLLWEKAKDFLTKAFTVIFIASLIIWFLQTFDLKLNVVKDSSNSILAMVGKLIAPIFAPLGFDKWEISTSLICGFTAKEAVVSTLGILTNSASSSLSNTLTSLFPSALSAVAFLVFTLLYTPCVATVSTIKKELNSRFASIGVVVTQCAVAWIFGALVYQIGNLIF